MLLILIWIFSSVGKWIYLILMLFQVSIRVLWGVPGKQNKVHWFECIWDFFSFFIVFLLNNGFLFLEHKNKWRTSGLGYFVSFEYVALKKDDRWSISLYSDTCSLHHNLFFTSGSQFLLHLPAQFSCISTCTCSQLLQGQTRKSTRLTAICAVLFQKGFPKSEEQTVF